MAFAGSIMLLIGICQAIVAGALVLLPQRHTEAPRAAPGPVVFKEA